MRRPARAARGMAGGFQPQLPGAGAVQHPAGEAAFFDKGAALVGDAFAVERLGAQPAQPVRIVNDGNAGGEHLFAHPVFQEADAARDGVAGNRPGEMADNAGGFAHIEHHRHALRFHLARIHPRDGALPCRAPDIFGAAQIARMPGAGVIIIALHARAFARQHGNADAMAGAGVAAIKPVAGGQRHSGAGERRAAAFGIAHALDGHGGAFGIARPRHQNIGSRFFGIFQIKGGNVFRQPVRRRQPGIFVFRRQLRHGDGALRQARQRIGGKIGGGDERHLAAQEHPQPQIGAFAALDIFQLAQAIGNAGGDILHKQGIGGIRPRLFGGGEQGGEDFLASGCHAHSDAAKAHVRQARAGGRPFSPYFGQSGRWNGYTPPR